jgi:hypothetical protein
VNGDATSAGPAPRNDSRAHRAPAATTAIVAPTATAAIPAPAATTAIAATVAALCAMRRAAR